MTTCDRCGEMNPADIHTCTPQVPADPYASENDTQELLRIGKLPAALRLAELLEKTMQWPLHGKAADELRRLHAIEQAVHKLHKAKGRYHTQLAICDLFDAAGLPNVRPTKGGAA